MNLVSQILLIFDLRRLRWLTAEFTALSPSIYLDASANNTAANYRYIYAVLSEARRIAEGVSGLNT